MQNLYLTIAHEVAKKGDIVVWVGLKIWDGIGSIPHHNRHISITSDEEIKEGYIISNNIVYKVWKTDDKFIYWQDGEYLWSLKRENCKKIILTTDLKLVADGVQAIDDEFKNWFIQNQNCEYVEVVGVLEQVEQSNPILYGSTNCFFKYKILTK